MLQLCVRCCWFVSSSNCDLTHISTVSVELLLLLFVLREYYCFLYHVSLKIVIISIILIIVLVIIIIFHLYGTG